MNATMMHNATATACAIPVVAAAVGGLKFVVIDGQTGFLVEQIDVQVLRDETRANALDRVRAGFAAADDGRGAASG